MNSLGQNIKQARIKKSLTQQDFAEKLYVSDKTISSWEHNRTIPDINMLFKISSLLDTSIYSLINEDYYNLQPLEMEIKLKMDLKEYTRLLNIFQEAKIKLTRVEQIDTYYVPTYKKFSNEWLRIREEHGKYILTYKKKITEMCCQEYESLIDNYSNFENILINLGLQKKGVIHKKRIKALYQNKYEFSFDEVENVGLFVEIEVKKFETTNKKEIEKLINLLDEFKIDLKLIDNKRYFDYLKERVK